MDNKSHSDTKTKLILTAGKLFAQEGFEATSVRTISEKAKVNISAINYHFGSKENLYMEVIKYIIAKNSKVRPSSLLKENSLLKNKEEISKIIKLIIEDKFSSLLSLSEPAWFQKLMIRTITETPSAHKILTKEVFKPELDALKNIIQKAKPDMSDFETAFVITSIHAHLVFLLTCQTIILTTFNIKKYDKKFIQQIIKQVTKLIFSTLEL